MATGTNMATFSNRECLFRLLTLIIDGGTEVLRNIFDQRLHGMSLSAFLGLEKKRIESLKRQKAITKAQFELLYPPSGQPPTSKDFDISLIISLLTNIKSLGLNQNYIQFVSPRPTDLSREADLSRLRGFRNEFSHISSTTRTFQQTSFDDKWTDVEQVLLRLNSTVRFPLSNFKQTIDSYKNIQVDAAAEQRYQTEIQQWRQMELGLVTEMREIKDKVKSTHTVVSDSKQDLKDIKQDVINTKQGVEKMEKDVKEMKQGIENIQRHVKDIKQNIIYTRQDVHVIQRKVNVIERGATYIR